MTHVLINQKKLRASRLIWALILCFGSFNLTAQFSPQDLGWPRTEPASVAAQPPDPNEGDGVPLSGFEYMLMASFAFGVWLLAKQRASAIQAN